MTVFVFADLFGVNVMFAFFLHLRWLNVGTDRVNGTEGNQHFPPFTQVTWKWVFYVLLLEIKRYLRYYEEIPILKSR